MLGAPGNLRWLHLSDFHVGKDHYAQRRMFERIVRHVSEKVASGFGPSFLFITGDIADKGLSKEYEVFNFEFLDALQKSIGDDIASRTFAVPGNHDVDRRRRQAFDQREMSDPAKRYFDPTEDGRENRELLFPRFETFAQNDCTAPKGLWLTSTLGHFAVINEINDRKIGIAGINTAWLSKDEFDREHMTPGKPLLEQALSYIKGCDLRVVLGHHPLDWMLPNERRMITSLLGKASAVYLHGHLHDTWVDPTYGGGGASLLVQCAAGFQAREGERWRNGLLWAEVDFAENIVRFQPWTWSAAHQDWTLAADAFPESRRNSDWWEYSLPGTSAAAGAKTARKSAGASIPKGWSVSSLDELRTHTPPLESDAAIRFFDGGTPGWPVAFSSAIPDRAVVGKLAQLFVPPPDEDRPRVVLLTGAACEGKTTAVLQTARSLLEKNPTWKVLRRADETLVPNTLELLPLLASHNDWLIVIDEADNAATGVLDLIKQAPGNIRSALRFLLASRDSDWRSSSANTLPWTSLCSFAQQTLSGLDDGDATRIVDAWANFGEAGLGRTALLRPEERAQRLVEAARDEAKVSQGAFFGALLAVRVGEDMQKHAKSMLARLAQNSIPGGRTLRDALSFIAAMHAEGLEFLSRPVLATVLGCPLDKLRAAILLPLGEEAATTTSSEFVFTRHPRIAQAILTVLASEFGEDTDLMYVDLVEAALDAVAKGHFVPPLVAWRYRLPDHFFDTGREALAISIAKAVVAREPLNLKPLVNLAQLYRKTDALDLAIKVFKDVPSTYPAHRGFFTEWATAHGNAGDSAASVLLAAYSVSDECETVPPDNEAIKLGLAGMAVAFGKLFSAYSEHEFDEARAACAVIGSHLKLDHRAASYFTGYLERAAAAKTRIPTIDTALSILKAGIVSAAGYTSDVDVLARIGEPKRLTFEGIVRLVRASAPRIHS